MYNCVVQIPDVSAVLHTSDYPCLKANRSVVDIEFRQPDTTLPDDHWNGAAAGGTLLCSILKLAVHPMLQSDSPIVSLKHL